MATLITHEELDALPEWPTGFGQIEEVIDGRRVVRPVMYPQVAFFMGPDDGSVIDNRDGTRWMIGRHEGVRYKRKMLA